MAADRFKVALLFRGDREARDTLVLPDTRLAKIAYALSEVGVEPIAAVFSEAFAEEVRQQLLAMDGVLVWVDPFTEAGDRSLLDELLREVARAGVLVSAHPDTILRMGTKEVLHATKDMPWGSDVRLYRTPDELRRNLPDALLGGARVLKQYRGNGGNGVFKVELAETTNRVEPHTLLKVRHARRGSIEKTMDFNTLAGRMSRNFAGSGRIIDQAWQARMTEGVIRCYFVRNKVEGFGEQLVNALYPASRPDEPVQPGPRLYYPPDREDLQTLKQVLEAAWLPEMQRRLEVEDDILPVIWDADFFRGSKNSRGEDSWVLCEINVSAVYPFPDEALAPLARETRRRLAGT